MTRVPPRFVIPQDFALLREVSRVIAMAETPDDLLRSVCRATQRAIPLQTVVLSWQQGPRLEQRSWRAPQTASRAEDKARRQVASAHAYFTGGAAHAPERPLPNHLTLPLVVGTGDVFGVAGLGCRSDLDEQGVAFASALANQLAIALDRLEQRRIREDLLAMVSHELGNTALAMRLSIGTLARSLQAPVPAALGDLEFLAREIDVLVSDLDARARLEAERFRLTRTPTDLGALTRMTVRALESAAEATGVSLVCQVVAELPTVSADPVRISQVLTNLIGNALKFTPRGGRVEVKVRRDKRALRATIQDSGPGIAQGDRGHVFERFWQQRGFAHPGMGLGLSVCEGIVQAHGGRIWVESPAGRGARFHFTVPIAV